MSTKMKGLLKGLRYISQIFEEEEEPELQIGLPTDVKHVAHIGWDGPTTNAPSWINQFKGEGGDPTAAPPGALPPTVPTDGAQTVPKPRESRPPAEEKRNSTGPDSTLRSPSRRRSDKPKGSRKNNSNANSSSLDSPKRSSTSENRSKLSSSGPDSPPRDSTSSQKSEKTSRRKKSKGGSSAGASSSSKTSSKSKTAGQSMESSPFSDPGLGGGGGGGQQSRSTVKSKERCQGSVLKASEEDQKALDDDIPRGIHAL